MPVRTYVVTKNISGDPLYKNEGPPLNQLDIDNYLREILAPTGAQVVEHADAVAAPQ